MTIGLEISSQPVAASNILQLKTDLQYTFLLVDLKLDKQ